MKVGSRIGVVLLPSEFFFGPLSDMFLLVQLGGKRYFWSLRTAGGRVLELQ